MKFIKPLILLFLIIGIGFFLRFYKLGQIPAGLYLDEAAQGYNAYSILKTGKDEYGKNFPIIFRSFGDFKTPLYIYLIVPLIPIFDLTKFTVRFPSFFFSVLTFPLLYLLILEISPKKVRYPLALISTLLLSISPWHILFGRTNFECNVALFLLLAGIYLFFKGLKIPKLFILSALFFGLSFSAYHSERIISPLIVFALAIRYRQTIFNKKNRAVIIVSTLIGLLIVLPTLSVISTAGFASRATTLSIFNFSRIPAGFIPNIPPPFNFIINNHLVLSIKEFLSLYFSYFSPRNMFYLGDSGPRSSFPELATFYIWQLPFYILGLFLILKDKKLADLRFLTLIFFFVSPVPAALTSDPYSTIRALPLVIPQLIIISLSLLRFFRLFKPIYLKIIVFSVFILTITFSLIHLYSSVFILNEYFRAKDWNYGWQQVTEEIKKLDPKLPIVVDNARGEAYSQLLFFLKKDPLTYQTNNFEVTPNEYYSNLSRQTNKKIDQISVRSIDWVPDTKVNQYLIGDYLAISQEQIKTNKLQLIAEIKYPDSSPAFIITKTNPE